jgi:hypothetical protein
MGADPEISLTVFNNSLNIIVGEGAGITRIIDEGGKSPGLVIIFRDAPSLGADPDPAF